MPEPGPRPRGARDFRLLLAGFFVSTTGDWLYRLALPLLVLERTGSAVGTAFAYALEFAPYVLLSVAGGVAADRFDRRRLMIAGDAASAAILLGLVALVETGPRAVWPIYVVAFGLSCVRPIYHPAFQSLVPDLVEGPGLLRANSRLQVVDSVLGFAGPVAGGAAVAALGASHALLLDAASFAASAGAIALVPSRPAARAGRSATAGMLAEVREAFAYLRRVEVMWWALLLVTGTNFAIFLVQANLVFYIVRFLDRPISAVGFVLGAQGLGAVAGALATPVLARRLDGGRLTILGMLGAGAGTAVLLPARSLPAIAAGWALVGASDTIIVVTWFTLRQRIVPRELLGRVVALQRSLAFAVLPAGAVVGGLVLASTDDAVPLIGLSVAVHLGLAALALGSPLRTAPPLTVLADGGS